MFNDPAMNLVIILVMFLWVLPWKGYALWTAVKKNDKGWFLALIVLNTLGILEIIYIFGFAKKTWPDIKEALYTKLKF